MDGYVRSDMTQMLTIAELQQFLAEQAARATPTPKANAGVSTTPSTLSTMLIRIVQTFPAASRTISRRDSIPS